MLIDKNTVSAENQTINSASVYHLGNPKAKKRILIVGNSILRHGPCAAIGWERDWGMAASAPEKDFVHRLFAMLTGNGDDVYMRVSQCSAWETTFLEDNVLSNYDEDRNFDADIVVFRLGENVRENQTHFKDAMRKFVTHVCPNGKVVFTTCFWESPIIDKAIEEIAAERNEVCINGCFSKDEKNMALGQFAHHGVAIHPSDDGMEEIAKAIFEQLKKIRS